MTTELITSEWWMSNDERTMNKEPMSNERRMKQQTNNEQSQVWSVESHVISATFSFVCKHPDSSYHGYQNFTSLYLILQFPY